VSTAYVKGYGCGDHVNALGAVLSPNAWHVTRPTAIHISAAG